jgi:uncharacterized protein
MTLPVPRESATCLVTGASSGIGAELARELARRGHGLTLVARREERLRELAAELSDRHPVRIEVLAADLTDGRARHALDATLADRGLTVDVVVNNAGFSTQGPVHRSDATREVALVRTNVEAVVDLCSSFVPGMVERGTGAVLNVASTAAFQPLPGQAAYSASKAFVLTYSQALRAELGGTGVTVTALCPGPVETEFAQVMTEGRGDYQAGDALPRFMWVPAPQVARAAIDGLARGRAVVIPGAVNRAGAIGAHLVPRSLLLPLLARQHPALRKS